MTLETMLRLGGVVQLSVLAASALVPSTLDFKGQLARLDSFLRRLVWVWGLFIVLVIVGFGVLSLWHAESLASGSPLARGLCGLIACFWLARLGVQVFVFDARPYLKRPLYALGYHALTVAFTSLAFVYGWSAWFV